MMPLIGIVRLFNHLEIKKKIFTPKGTYKVDKVTEWIYVVFTYFLASQIFPRNWGYVAAFDWDPTLIEPPRD